METESVESVCIICRMAVVARVDTRFDSATFLRLFTFFQFYFLSYFLSFFILSLFFAMAVLKAIVSLYRAGEKKPIKGRPWLKSWKRIHYFRLSKKKHYRVSWAQRASSKIRLEVI